MQFEEWKTQLRLFFFVTYQMTKPMMPCVSKVLTVVTVPSSSSIVLVELLASNLHSYELKQMRNLGTITILDRLKKEIKTLTLYGLLAMADQVR